MSALRGQVCLLTGATGGIGRALVAALRSQGVQLALSDRDPDALKAMANALAAEGPRPSVHVADMRDPDSIRAMVASVEATHGRLDLLICNAGVMSFGPFADHKPNDIDWLLEVNLSGLVHCCHASVPLMRRSGGGHIVLMSSMNGLFGVPTSLLYSTTKWGVRGFGMGLRAELAAHGIGVTTVLPGAVATSLIAEARSYDDTLVAQIKPFIERFALNPNRLARRILRAIRWNLAESTVGVDAWSVRILMRWFPRLLPTVLTWSFRGTAARVEGTTKV